MSGLVELLSEVISGFVSRDSEEEYVRVAYTAPSTLVFLEDDYVELVRGAEYNVPRWIAQLLAEKGCAKILEEGVDAVDLGRLMFNESRSRGQIKFEKLKGYFYSKVKSTIQHLLKQYKSATNIDEIKRISDTLSTLSSNTKNLYKIRLSKILSLLSVQELPPEVLGNLSEEEKLLYTTIRSVLEVFNERVFEV
ncbi:MAG: DNA replication complex GINS family protein [Desulfurococcaceae archaeon]|nr:DNA replication complex GINS family protein [Desulfurococcaceae archaeon]MCC6053297.1 DNA replication complex GINS family protein [Desulfurococcaceae archaeon]